MGEMRVCEQGRPEGAKEEELEHMGGAWGTHVLYTQDMYVYVRVLYRIIHSQLMSVSLVRILF